MTGNCGGHCGEEDGVFVWRGVDLICLRLPRQLVNLWWTCWVGSLFECRVS